MCSPLIEFSYGDDEANLILCLCGSVLYFQDLAFCHLTQNWLPTIESQTRVYNQSARLCCSSLVPAFRVQSILKLAASVGSRRGYFQFKRCPELGRASGFSIALSLALYVSDG